MDAGPSGGDVDARLAQVQQLATAINANSVNHAVIVAGDTNLKPADDSETLAALLSDANLSDSCQALSCPEPERIDRIMYRSSSTLMLTASSWQVDSSFVDEQGEDLSDHEAVAVTLSWTAL